MNVNLAGTAQNDPILKGLGINLIASTLSLNVAVVNDFFIDSSTGFPGTNSEKANLSPAATELGSGANATYDDSTKVYTFSPALNVSVGDYVSLSHTDLTDDFYKVATKSGADITFENNPLNTLGNKTLIAYQVAWRLDTTTASSPITSSAAGSQNFLKADVENSGGNNTQVEASFWVADAPSGSAYVALDGGDYTGQTVTDNLISLAVLAGWVNKGGVSHMGLGDHSSQSVNDASWTSGGGTGEVTIAVGEAGITLSNGDGIKYFQLLLKSESGGTEVAIDMSITLDTTGPNAVLGLDGS